MWNFYIWIDYNKNHMLIFPDCGKKKKMKPSTNILHSLISCLTMVHTRNQKSKVQIKDMCPLFLPVWLRIPWNPCDQNLNENCTALLTIKVSAKNWLASVNSWRRSSSFTKCNIGQMDSDQRKQKSTVMNPPLPKKELHHVEWVWTQICSLPARFPWNQIILLKLSQKQESVTDKWTKPFAIPPLR